MGTTLHDLQPPDGARHRKKRVGRGLGSKKGKTSTRGSKGQLKHRTSMSAAFEGGQLPIHRRVPKRGFVNIHRVPVHGINISAIASLDAGTEVTVALLHEKGLIPKKAKIVKLLGNGDIDKKLTIKLDRASASARKKIEAAGGTLDLVAPPEATPEPKS